MEKKNSYKGFWKGMSLEICAETSYKAQQALLPLFQASTRKKVKNYDITVVLCELNGKQVVHTPDF